MFKTQEFESKSPTKFFVGKRKQTNKHMGVYVFGKMSEKLNHSDKMRWQDLQIVKMVIMEKELALLMQFKLENEAWYCMFKRKLRFLLLS